MSCPKVISPLCKLGSPTHAVTSSLANGLISGLAHSVHSAVASIVAGSVDWWVSGPSPNLTTEPSVQAMQHWLMPVTVAVAVAGMLAGAAKMTLTRKANPLVDVGTGLVILIVTSAIGVLLATILLRAGDAWTTWILTQSADGHFGGRLTRVLSFDSEQPFAVIMFGAVAIVLTVAQAVLMAFRQVAVIILAGVLPLAAAGAMTPSTRRWLRRVSGWMLAFIFYKPAAAAVYATAFTLVGRGHDPRTVSVGFAMVFLSLFALPALMKFFTWATVSVDSPGGGGGLLGTALNGAIAVGAVRGASPGSSGTSPVDQARLLSSQLSAQATSGPGNSGEQGRDRSSGPQGAAPGSTAPFGPRTASPAGANSATGGAASQATTAAAASGAAGATTTAATSATTSAAAAAGAAAGPVGMAATAAADGAVRAGRRTADALHPDGKDS